MILKHVLQYAPILPGLDVLPRPLYTEYFVIQIIQFKFKLSKY